MPFNLERVQLRWEKAKEYIDDCIERHKNSPEVLNALEEIKFNFILIEKEYCVIETKPIN